MASSIVSPSPLFSPTTKYSAIDVHEDAESNAKKSRKCRKGRTFDNCLDFLNKQPGWLLFAGLMFNVLAPLLLLVVWTAHNATLDTFHNILAPASVGGRLTLIEAKAIDFICSTVLGPLVMLGLDYTWFRSAKSTIMNERHQHKGVPLSSLLQATSTDSGGFDLGKFKSFFTAGAWSMGLFGLLVALSGIAGKLVTNVIAYEALNDTIAASNQTTLRYLSGPELVTFDPHGADPPREYDLSYLSVPQQALIANEMTALLTGLNFQSAETKLQSDYSYVAINATSDTLDNLDMSIVDLPAVPVFRLTMDCKPFHLDGFSSSQAEDWYYELKFWKSAEDTYEAANVSFSAKIPGIMTLDDDGAGISEYPLVAFDSNGSNAAYLGVMTNGNKTDPKYNIDSSYGAVEPHAFLTHWNKSTSKDVFTTLGIECKLWRQEGTAALDRRYGRFWAIKSMNFSPDKIDVPSMLFDYQVSLRYQAVKSTIAGLGPALAQTAGVGFSSPMNFTLFALNYLYASGEARRITYEVESNSTSPELYYNVTALQSVEFYRITYVPLLLILSLLTISVAALVPVILSSSAFATTTFRTSRELTDLRLLLDAVVGLQEIVPEIAKQEDDIEYWAENLRVRFEEAGKDIVRLRRVTGYMTG